MPIVWAYLKTYYDHLGKHPQDFNWILPNVNPEDDHNIKKSLLQNPPDIFGFSAYMWNTNQCYRIAEWVRKEFPNCLIVAGGPDLDYKWWANYFEKRPYIDIIVPHEGEIPFTDILDTVAEGRTDFGECANLVLPDSNPFQGWKKSNRSVPRKHFEFPPSAFHHCQKELEAMMEETIQNGKSVASIAEFNRGCPYQCTFCDWGGGTYTKIRRKPQEIVNWEIEWMSKQPIQFLTLTDANLGVFQQDVDNIKKMVELRKETGWPAQVRYSSAKNNKDRVLDIFLTLAREEAAENYCHSFQDANEDVKDIIKRKDISWGESKEIARAIKKEGFTDSMIQMILGLPGQTWETFLSNIDPIMAERGLFNWPRYYPFLLLPNSPAAEPAYVSQYNIKVVQRGLSDDLPRIRTDIPTDWFNTRASYFKEGVDQQRGWYVVETSTFSREDYVNLFTFSHIIFCLHSLEMTKLIPDYLNEKYGVQYRDFYRGIYEDFMLQENPETSAVGGFTQHWLDHFRKWTKEETDIGYSETCIPWDDKELPWEMPGNMYFQYHLLIHREEFFQKLETYLIGKYQIPELADLIRYSKETVIDFNHSLQEKKTFESTYNWEGFFQGEELKKGNFSYEILDKTVTYGLARGTFPIDWADQKDPLEKKLQFIYRVAYSRHHSARYKKIALLNKYLILSKGE